MSHPSTLKAPYWSLLRTFVSVFLSILVCGAAAGICAAEPTEETPVFSKRWEYKVIPNLDVAAAADAANVYFLDYENKLHAVDLALGNKLWSSELGGEVVSNLLVVEQSVFVVTASPGDPAGTNTKATLRSVSSQTGITEWRAEIASSTKVWLGAAGEAIVAVGSNGSISALTRAGEFKWKSDLLVEVTAVPTFDESGVDLGTAKNEVLAISAADGRARVAWTSRHLPTAVVIDSNGRLVVGDERGNLTLVSSDGDRVWRFRNGAQISAALLHESEYLATSYDNFVYKLSRGGDVKWKRRLSGRVSDRPLVFGDTAVISILGTGSIYVLDLRNGKISNRIEMGEEISTRITGVPGNRGFIIVGPNGLSYFANNKLAAK